MFGGFFKATNVMRKPFKTATGNGRLLHNGARLSAHRCWLADEKRLIGDWQFRQEYLSELETVSERLPGIG